MKKRKYKQRKEQNYQIKKALEHLEYLGILEVNTTKYTKMQEKKITKDCLRKTKKKKC